jgi:tartrate-resistant acid phosphatase type 5
MVPLRRSSFEQSLSRLRPQVRCCAILLLSTLVFPVVATGATVLAVVGDIGSPNAGATRVANMVGRGDGPSAWGTDFVLALGDNSGANYAVGSSEWDNVIGARYGQFIKKRSGTASGAYPSQTSIEQRFFPVVGDHDRDIGTGSRAGYLDYFHSDPGQAVGRLPTGVHEASQSFYDFTLPIEGGVGSIRVFAMDSEAFGSSAESQALQIAWLRDGLRSSTATWNFVTLHSPAFSSSLHHSNPLYQLPFQQWGAHAVMSGHDHVYERLRVTDASQNEMLYFVNGLGGSTIYPFTGRATGSEVRYNQDFGAMRLTVTDNEAVFDFFSTSDLDGNWSDGALVDTFTLRRDALPVPPVVTADLNDDGFVDELDLALWRTAFAISDKGDANGDMNTNGDDFLLWQQQRSIFRPDSLPTVSAVPEPMMTVNAVTAIVVMSLAARPRRVPS